MKTRRDTAARSAWISSTRGPWHDRRLSIPGIAAGAGPMASALPTVSHRLSSRARADEACRWPSNGFSVVISSYEPSSLHCATDESGAFFIWNLSEGPPEI